MFPVLSRANLKYTDEAYQPEKVKRPVRTGAPLSAILIPVALSCRSLILKALSQTA